MLNEHIKFEEIVSFIIISFPHWNILFSDYRFTVSVRVTVLGFRVSSHRIHYNALHPVSIPGIVF